MRRPRTRLPGPEVGFQRCVNTGRVAGVGVGGGGRCWGGCQKGQGGRWRLINAQVITVHLFTPAGVSGALPVGTKIMATLKCLKLDPKEKEERASDVCWRSDGRCCSCVT